MGFVVEVVGSAVGEKRLDACGIVRSGEVFH